MAEEFWSGPEITDWYIGTVSNPHFKDSIYRNGAKVIQTQEVLVKLMGVAPTASLEIDFQAKFNLSLNTSFGNWKPNNYFRTASLYDIRGIIKTKLKTWSLSGIIGGFGDYPGLVYLREIKSKSI